MVFEVIFVVIYEEGRRMSLLIVECCCSRFREGAVITFSRANAGFRNDSGNPLVVSINEIECDCCPFCGEKVVTAWAGDKSGEEESEVSDEV